MKRIEGRAKSVRELMDGTKYTIDFYQREYAWQERQVHELIDDLTGKFLDFYDDDHSRPEVERYGHYFLGSIVISLKRGRRYIVDGQQRLTTLTLLLIHLHHLQDERDDRVEVKNLVFSERYGRRSFNLDVAAREPVMDALLNGQRPDLDDDASDTLRNIALRYDNIADHFPEELEQRALPFFVDWLLDNVHLVEIEAYSDEDAYTIFETMNDRGLSLSLPDMLKGYLLANIRHEDDQRRVNALWKKRLQRLRDLGDEEDVSFFKNWLRARHAETIRAARKGAENKDFERIGSEFHRWVRDQRERLGLAESDDYVRFVERDFDFYARAAERVRKAALALTDGLESIRYNEERGFTLQNQLLLAPLEPGDSAEVVGRKLRLVADFLDIWLARRVWNFRTIAYSSVRYTIFNFCRDVRGLGVDELAAYLRRQLDEQPESFATNPTLRLHKQNYRQVRHLLARLTHWVDTQCGLASHFEDLVSEGRARPFEIEHIWADRYDEFSDLFEHPSDFEVERNRLGGLLLLQRSINQSLGGAGYEQKRDAYMAKGENLLARSLHPLAYEKDPPFARFLERTGLGFRPYERFGPEEQRERQILYLRIAEWIWNPSRLDLDGEKPPEHEELGVIRGPQADPAEADARRKSLRLRFFTALLAKAAERTDLHRNISPTDRTWVSSRAGLNRLGSLVYMVRPTSAQVELYLDCGDKERNKRIFDALEARREELEERFGDRLIWERRDNRKSSSIYWRTSNGSWSDDSTWDEVHDELIDAMIRLDATLRPPLLEVAG